MEGKYGIFFSCIKCGNISPSRVFEINEVVDVSKNENIKEPASNKEKPKFFNDKIPLVEKGVCVENYESKYNF
jgi:hypothetical protein